MTNVITFAELNTVIERFGQYAVLACQRETHAVFPGGWFPPSVLMALGLRETNLQNICGGATLEGDHWVQAYTDRGVFQITDTQVTNAAWLRTVPGCPNGSWVPEHGHTALESMHCPTLSAAIGYTLKEMTLNRRLAYGAGVAPEHALQFIVAAHNGGFTGALNGYKEGNVDANTTLGDYSWWVLHYAPQIAAWIAAHPTWTWHPPAPVNP